MQMNIRLIIFDLGRVLVRLCDNWRHACEVAAVPVERALEIDPAKRAEMMKLVVAHESGVLDQSTFCQQMSPLLEVDPRHVQAMSEVYLLGIYPGAVELIDALNAAGYQTACLSNTNANHWANMFDPNHPAWLPMDRFTYCFGSHLIGHRKPAEQIYRYVENETGMRGGQIVFFDDIAENVEAALARGWHARLIRRDADPIKQIHGHLAELGIHVASSALDDRS